MDFRQPLSSKMGVALVMAVLAHSKDSHGGAGFADALAAIPRRVPARQIVCAKRRQ
jgi:hypothetical protein